MSQNTNNTESGSNTTNLQKSNIGKFSKDVPLANFRPPKPPSNQKEE